MIRSLRDTALDGTSAGNSNSLDIWDSEHVVWVANVSVLSGGAPGITFSWEHSSDNATWFAIAAEASIAAAPDFKSRLIRTERTFRFVRVSWTVGTNATGTIEVYIQAFNYLDKRN